MSTADTDDALRRGLDVAEPIFFRSFLLLVILRLLMQSSADDEDLVPRNDWHWNEIPFLVVNYMHALYEPHVDYCIHGG